MANKYGGVQQMGLGELGGPALIFKRKFRWTFAIIDNDGGERVPADFVKLSARPNLTIEETEINYLNAKTWIPGKAAWETITVTYYDVATEKNKGLFDWLASVYDFTSPTDLGQASKREDYAGTGVLTMFDGAGTNLEEWSLDDMWPQAINFGELDYSSSEECNIELTLRYSKVSYTNNCPGFTITPKITPCP